MAVCEAFNQHDPQQAKLPAFVGSKVKFALWNNNKRVARRKSREFSYWMGEDEEAIQVIDALPDQINIAEQVEMNFIRQEMTKALNRKLNTI